MNRSTKEYVPNEAAAERNAIARKEEQRPIETTEPTKKKLRKPRPVQQATELAFKALIRQGFNASKASAFLGMHPTTGSKILKRLQDKGEQISGLISAERDEKLGRLVDHFLDKGAKLRTVKGSDAIAAGKLYADRRYPVRTDPAPPSVVYSQVNLIEIRDPDPTKYVVPAPAGQVIDLEPEPESDATTIGDIQTPRHESGPDEDPA